MLSKYMKHINIKTNKKKNHIYKNTHRCFTLLKKYSRTGLVTFAFSVLLFQSAVTRPLRES